MKRYIAYSIIAVLVIGGVFFFYHSKKLSGISSFNTSPIERGTVEQMVTATGTLDTVSSTNVGSEVSGVIKTIFVEHNSKVKKGQILAQINPETVMTQVDRAKASLQKTKSSYQATLAQVGNAQAEVQKMEANRLSVMAKAQQAKANVSNAKASVSNAEAGINSAQAQIATAQANVRKAQAECENCKINYDRQEALHKQDLIAQTDRDDAYTAYRAAQATLDSAKANLTAAQASLRSAQATLSGAKASYESAVLNLSGVQADVDSATISVSASRQSLAAAQANAAGAKADVEQSQASLDSAIVDLGKTSIRSPIDGVVLSVLVDEGQTVAAQFQAPELFKLAKNLDEMQVEALVDEADIGQVKPGDSATFTVDTWANENFTGKVLEVRKAATTTNNVVTYPVIISTRNSSLKLMPGMTATVSIAVSQAKDVLLLPSQALRFKPENKLVSNFDELNSKKAEASPTADVPSVSPSPASGTDTPTAALITKLVYTEDPTTPGKVIGHKVNVGITDGTNSQLLQGSDLKEGDLVVTEITAKDTKRRGHRGPL